MEINGSRHRVTKHITYAKALLFYGSKLSNMERMIHSISKVKKKSSLIFSTKWSPSRTSWIIFFLVRMEKLPVSDVRKV